MRRSALRPRQLLQDRSGHTLRIRQNLVVPEPDNAPPLALQPNCPALIRLRGGMLPAIRLDDEANFDCSEIGEERADRMLAPELAAVQLPTAQNGPQSALRVGRGSAKLAGMRRRMLSADRHG